MDAGKTNNKKAAKQSKKAAAATAVAPVAGKAAKRHAKANVDVWSSISGPSIRRIARRGGVKRASADLFPATRTIMGEFLNKIISDSVIISQASGRKTVSLGAVQFALSRNNVPFFGTP